MRNVLLLLLLLCVSEVYAQTNSTLSPKMTAFKEYCVRAANAAAVCNTDELIKCIEGWEPAEGTKDEKFVYEKELINYVPFGTFLLKDTVQETVLNNHFKFLPVEVDNWIVNKCEPVAIADAHALRKEPTHCEYVVRALKAKGKGVYVTRGAGNVEMFVVAESGGKINFSVHAVETNFKKEIIGETNLSDNGGSQSAQLIWAMNRNGEINFTVENLTDKEISFIVVKKL